MTAKPTRPRCPTCSRAPCACARGRPQTDAARAYVRDYSRGYRAGRAGKGVQTDASPAWLTGHARGREIHAAGRCVRKTPNAAPRNRYVRGYRDAKAGRAARERSREYLRGHAAWKSPPEGGPGRPRKHLPGGGEGESPKSAREGA